MALASINRLSWILSAHLTEHPILPTQPLHMSCHLPACRATGEARPPLTVVLVNNAGGGIFSFLPIAEALPEEVFTPLWATPQHVDLEGACHAALCCAALCCAECAMHACAALRAPCTPCDVACCCFRLPGGLSTRLAHPAFNSEHYPVWSPPCRHVPRSRHPASEGGRSG
jgi:hypothetical protein